MVIARAVVDRTVADELRDACVTMGLKLGGWDKPPERRNRKSTSKRSHRAAAAVQKWGRV
jgi:hypothetical protein